MKKWCAVFLTLLLLIAAIPTAFASGKTYVIDDAKLLTEDEILQLNEMAQMLSDQYGMDYVIVTTNTTCGKSSADYADDYYDANGYGQGTDYSGTLLLIDMESRIVYLSTCGKAIRAFTDYGISLLQDLIVEDLSQGSYFQALYAYLSAIPDYMNSYNNGNPVDRTYPGSTSATGSSARVNWLISILAGLAAAGITLTVCVSSMNSKRAQKDAISYLEKDSYILTQSHDRFLYSSVTKTPKPENNSSGSTTHRSSSGRVHGGGGRKF